MKEKIVAAAKKEFLKKGFREFSLDHLAKKYHFPYRDLIQHYQNKDELFSDVLRPQTDAILRRLELKERMDVEFIKDNTQELDLLFNRSEESSLSDFMHFVALEMSESRSQYFTRLAYLKTIALVVESDLDEKELGEVIGSFESMSLIN